MRVPLTTTLLTLMMCVASLGEAMAWGGLGHRTAAEIAERNLTPKAKAVIEQYTKGRPLADYSVWMDKIDKNDIHHKRATRGWHASIVNAECKTSQEIRNKHRKGRDAVTGLIALEKMLKEREKLSDSTVMFALKCIIHMVADMHCPAHLRYTDNNNDGKFPVYFFGKKTTLHKVWDTSVLLRQNGKIGYREYAELLDNYSPRQVKRATKGWFEDWLEDAGRDIRPTLAWAHKGAKLDTEFQQKGYPLAEELLQKSGYRLAKTLNRLFE